MERNRATLQLGCQIVVCLNRVPLHILLADQVILAGGQSGDKRVIEGLRLLFIKLEPIQCKINCAVKDEARQVISVQGGISLRVLCAVTFAIQPESVISNELAEILEVFHSLFCAEIL